MHPADARHETRETRRAYHNNERDAALRQSDERFAELPKLLCFGGVV